jgi:hypothetical protein
MGKGIKPIPYWQLLPFIVITAILIYLSGGNIFFWDTIQLGSKQAHWYFENNFSVLLLPDLIDSGHPPLFGIYLAALWKVFGKTLMISHLAMLPFLFGILFYSYKLGQYFIGENYAWLFPLFIMANPCYLGHSILISPDILLLCFLLFAFYYILKNKRNHAILGLLGLSLISTRGMALVFCLFVFELIFSIKPSIIHRLKILIPKYAIACSLTIIFLTYHYIAKSWIGFSSDSPWASNFEWAGISGIIRNMAVLGWKLSDFGNIFLTSSIVVLYLWYKRRKKFFNQGVSNFVGLGVIILIVFSIMILPFKSLINPRYFLPLFILFGFIAACLFVPLLKERRSAKYLLAILISGLFIGNFWIYPKQIAQGWDSTMGHVPYYSLQEKMMDYIENENIPLHTIGTEFPNRGPIKFMDLSKNEEGIEESDFDKHDYILYSTIMNDFSDEELMDMEQNWEEVKKLTRAKIEMILYKRK